MSTEERENCHHGHGGHSHEDTKATSAAVSQHFSERAEGWDKKDLTQYISRECFNYVREKVVPLASDGSDPLANYAVLDLGCGTGLLSQHLQPLVKKLVGVDPAEGMIKQYEKKINEFGWDTNTACFCADIASEDIDMGPYDLVISVMAFHHIDDVPKMLRTLAKYLKPGTGKLAVFDLQLTEESVKFHPKAVHDVVLHHGGFSRDTWKEWLTSAGYGEISIEVALTMRRPEAEEGESNIEHPVDATVATLQ